MQAEILLVSSAFFHSLWNFIYKRLNPKDSALLLIVSMATVSSVLVAPFTGGFQFGSTQGIVFTIIAGLFEAGYFHSLSRTYESAPFGLSYSIMRGGAMLVVTFVSALFLSEPMTLIKSFGVLALVVGIFLTPSKDESSLNRTGFFWALSCSVFIAGYHLFYGFALSENVSQVTLFILSMLTSVPFLALKDHARAVSHIKRIKSTDFPWIKVAGILSAASFILFLYGLKNSHPGIAISLRNTSILFTQGFALYLGERLSRRQWMGIFAIFAGAILVSLK